MTPQYIIRCQKCWFERPLLLTSSADYDQIVSTMPCEECAKHNITTCDWKKIPTAANLKPDGTYSWRDK